MGPPGGPRGGPLGEPGGGPRGDPMGSKKRKVKFSLFPFKSAKKSLKALGSLGPGSIGPGVPWPRVLEAHAPGPPMGPHAPGPPMGPPHGPPWAPCYQKIFEITKILENSIKNDKNEKTSVKFDKNESCRSHREDQFLRDGVPRFAL